MKKFVKNLIDHIYFTPKFSLWAL